MTTPTLTREQADFLRVIASGRIVKICNQGHVEGEDQPSDEFIESLDGLIECVWDCVDHGESPDLTEAGREALAAYDAANVTIPNNVARLAVEALNYMADHRLVHEAFDASMQDELESAWRAIEAALEAK